jgi:hypothetical protein
VNPSGSKLLDKIDSNSPTDRIEIIFTSLQLQIAIGISTTLAQKFIDAGSPREPLAIANDGDSNSMTIETVTTFFTFCLINITGEIK